MWCRYLFISTHYLQKKGEDRYRVLKINTLKFNNLIKNAMNNSISLLINKKNSNLYFRYRLNGKTKDETITNLPYFAEPKNRDEERINKRSYKQAEQLLWEKRNDLAKSDLGIDYFEKRNQSFEIDRDFLKKIWIKQGKKCFYTGILMTTRPNHLFSVSIDR